MIQYKEAPIYQLKQHTETAHQELEALLIPKFSTIKKSEDFVDLLLYFHRFVTPLEALIYQQIDEKVLPDVAKRKKSYLLRDAIHSFGTENEYIYSTKLPRVTSVCQALGAMYVLEGSTLGGKSIVKLLQHSETICLTSSQYSYFNPYGDSTGSMWMAFQQVLNKWGENERGLNDIINVANDTFSCFIHSIIKPLTK